MTLFLLVDLHSGHWFLTWIDLSGDARHQRLVLKRLASAILNQALEDLDSPQGCKSDERASARRSAQELLLGENTDLKFWCDLAGIPMDAVIEAARQRSLALHTLSEPEEHEEKDVHTEPPTDR